MKKILAGTVLLLSVLLFSGCASDENILPYQGDSAEYIYAIGHNYMKEGDYTSAIKALKSLNAQYPFEHYSQLGTLDLIYSYYQKAEPAMVIATASQFIKLYPSNKDVGYAYYMMGVVHFDNGRGFLQRRLPYEMSHHDPSNYKKAFFELKRAVQLEPDANYVSDARRRMIYLNNTIGQYEYNIAKYNFEHAAYVGAINRAKTIVEQYPRSEAVEGALVLMIRSYKILNLPDMAVSSTAVLKENFPDNSYLSNLRKAKQRPTVLLN